jgi:subtilisin family serine protease
MPKGEGARARAGKSILKPQPAYFDPRLRLFLGSLSGQKTGDGPYFGLFISRAPKVSAHEPASEKDMARAVREFFVSPKRTFEVSQADLEQPSISFILLVLAGWKNFEQGRTPPPVFIGVDPADQPWMQSGIDFEHKAVRDAFNRSHTVGIHLTPRQLLETCMPLDIASAQTALPQPRCMLRMPLPVRSGLAYSVHEANGAPEDLPATPRGTTTFDGQGAVVAVIDFGCDFVHSNFRTRDGSTRLRCLWDQNAFGAPPGQQPPPTAPADQHFGIEFKEANINDALTKPDPYLALGYDPHANYVRPDPITGAHGTHVMDIAAGNGRRTHAPGVAPAADLAFIQVKGPPAGTAEPWDFKFYDPALADFPNELNVIYALNYAFHPKRGFGDAPVVANLSLSHNDGAHAGVTPLEQHIDGLVQADNRAVVVAAGNDRGRLRHSSGILNSSNNKRKLSWVFEPLSDEVAMTNRLYILALQSNVPGRHKIRIEGPDGAEPLVLLEEGSDRIMFQGQAVGQYASSYLPNIFGALIREVIVEIKHRNVAETWKAVFKGSGTNMTLFDAWIDCPSETQSHFEADDADPATTLSGCACGDKSVVVGAYDGQATNRRAAFFTGAGPTQRSYPLQKPEISAPGCGIWAATSKGPLYGQSGKTFSEAGAVVKSGTSMAAPHVAGAIALLYQKAIETAALNGTAAAVPIADIVAALKAGAAHNPPTRAWDPYYGFGRLDIAEALERFQP